MPHKVISPRDIFSQMREEAVGMGVPYLRRAYFLFFALACLIAISTGCAGPSEKPHVAPAPEIKYELEIAPTEKELKNDGDSRAEITVRVKKNDAYIDILPDDWTLTAHHDYIFSTLIIPEQDSNIYTDIFDGNISIIRVDPLSVGEGISTYVMCQVNPSLYEQNAQIVLEGKDTSGNIVFESFEYMTEGSEIYNFYWNGFLKYGGTAQPGTYSLRVKVGKYDSSSSFQEKASSKSVPVYVKGEIGVLVDAPIPFVSGKSKLVLTAPWVGEHRDKDNIIITLKNKAGGVEATNSGSPLTIVFIDPRLYRVSSSAIPAFSLDCALDGMPATVSFPGTGSDSTNKLVVAVYKGDKAKGITYTLDLNSKDISITNSSGPIETLTYGSEGYDEAGYIIADLIEKIQEEAYAQGGIMMNSSGNISITKDLRGATIDVREISEDIDIYKLKAKGNEYIFEYDKTTSSLTPQEGLNLEGAYSIDVAAYDVWLASLSSDYFAGVAAAGVSAAGVRAQSINAEDFKQLMSLAVIARVCLKHSASIIIGGILYGTEKLVTLYPRKYVGPAEITYGYTDDQSIATLDYIRGTAPESTSVNIYKNGTLYRTTSGGNWQINNVDLNSGRNKFNAIVVGSDGQEVESGEITINRGEPYYALFSPADRQVVWGDFTDLGEAKLTCNFRVLGYAAEGTTVTIRTPDGKEKSFTVGGSYWEFSGDILSATLNEGENQIQVLVSKDGKTDTLYKTIIAAYKFKNDKVWKNYVVRKGDMLFVSKTFNNPFDIIPKEPDHVGVYTGKGAVVEATWQGGVKENDLVNGENADYRNNNFKYAAQPRKTINELTRSSVAQRATDYKGKPYDWPFASVILKGITQKQLCLNMLGHYNGPTWGFYCSELAYYVWEEVVGQGNIISGAGMDRGKMMFLNMLLPAKLGKELMEGRKLGWND